ncbi:hypothetical protein DL96DRAFT_1589531 [Flagelloscypha sp. PMI_526]|nr:hypothetical protein DL96DRAFT_1589531 [Flagelloscypha sp. PMI_526]
MAEPTTLIRRGEFTNIAGHPLIAFFINVLLCGVLIVQVYIYYMAFPKDRGYIKAIVYVTFILELVQTAIQMYDRYQLNAVHYANPGSLDDPLMAWFSIPILTTVTSVIVQAFFGWRIYKFSKSWIMAGLVWLLSLVVLGSGMTQGIMSQPLTMSQVGERTTIPLTIWFVSTAVNDLLIATLLSYYLRRMKSGHEKTDRVVTRIVILTVETGTITAISALLIVVLFFVAPPWWLMFCDSIGKIYANNLMVMFNRRIKFTHDEPIAGSEQFSNGGIASIPQSALRVQREVSTWQDTYPMKGQDLNPIKSPSGRYIHAV